MIGKTYAGSWILGAAVLLGAIACGDEEGTQGPSGPRGAAGTACSVSEDESGNALFTCEDGTEVIITPPSAAPATIVETVPAREDQCPNGGVFIKAGRDENGDGQLQNEEVEHSSLVCNGGEGPSGADNPCAGRADLSLSAQLESSSRYSASASYKVDIAVETAAASDAIQLTLLGSGARFSDPVHLATEGNEHLFEAQWTPSKPSDDENYLVIAHDGCSVATASFNVEKIYKLPYEQLSSGLYHTCGLRLDQSVECWGDNMDPINPTRFFGQATAPAGRFVEIAAGGTQTCGIREDRSVQCWGGFFAQTEPTFQPEGLFENISVGFETACGLLADGRLSCWTNNSQNTISLQNLTGVIEPGLQIDAVHLSDAGPCLHLTDRRVWCAEGDFIQGAQGDLHFEKFALTTDGYCGLTANQSILCAGNEALTTNIPDGTNATDLSAGAGHVCALYEDGSARCWGINFALGDEPIVRGQTDVPAGHAFTQLSPGGEHTCALADTSLVVCWGSDVDIRGRYVGQSTPIQ